MNLSQILSTILAMYLTITLHECAHGLVALWNGDPTARDAGRITLNPVQHVDPMGLFFLVVFRIGWAKPVPINPYRFQNRRLGMLTTSLAGVTTNFFTAFLAALLLRIIPMHWVWMATFLLDMMFFGVFFCLFNLLPIPPLDGSKAIMSLLPEDAARAIEQTERYTRWLLPILVFTGLYSRFAQPLASRIISGMLNIAFAL
ncbi:MAG: site-2 protease family protein [Peptoniphilaceae bacterium]|nr:site-2 protease family protein [Peptoniphilaceae bacterium]MDY6086025.1 site-2 protease family protein [Peptoniphilaceae bacterium]